MVQLRAQECSVSTAAVVVAVATFRSVRSWQYFKVKGGMSKILCNLKKILILERGHHG